MSNNSWKNDCILFFLRMYNLASEYYIDYSERLRKIWDIGKYIWVQTEPTYYFKEVNEYPLPLSLYDVIPTVKKEDNIHIWTVGESHSEWNNASTVREGRRHRIMQLLAGEVYVDDTTKYEIPSNLLTIYSHCANQVPPTYEQWLQVIYAQTGYWSLRIPAYIKVINDMGEEKIIRIANEFSSLM
jgi:hypothetical protein